MRCTSPTTSASGELQNGPYAKIRSDIALNAYSRSTEAGRQSFMYGVVYSGIIKVHWSSMKDLKGKGKAASQRSSIGMAS